MGLTCSHLVPAAKGEFDQPGHMQMLAYSDGEVMDKWTLTKPADWQPDPQGQAAWLRTFQPHPPQDWVDAVGVNSGVVDEVSNICCVVLQL